MQIYDNGLREMTPEEEAEMLRSIAMEAEEESLKERVERLEQYILKLILTGGANGK